MYTSLRQRSEVDLSVNPLFGFAVLDSFLVTLREYLGDVTEATIKENFDIVYMVRAVDSWTGLLVAIWMYDSLEYSSDTAHRGDAGRGAPDDNGNEHVERDCSATYAGTQVAERGRCIWVSFMNRGLDNSSSVQITEPNISPILCAYTMAKAACPPCEQ